MREGEGGRETNSDKALRFIVLTAQAGSGLVEDLPLRGQRRILLTDVD